MKERGKQFVEANSRNMDRGDVDMTNKFKQTGKKKKRILGEMIKSH
jgi:hypothetical protein